MKRKRTKPQRSNSKPAPADWKRFEFQLFNSNREILTWLSGREKVSMSAMLNQMIREKARMVKERHHVE